MMLTQETDRLTVTVVTDNYYDALRPDPPVGERYRVRPGFPIHAEHGFSCHVTSETGGSPSTFIFDYGLDGRGVVNNMVLLNIDPEGIDALGLSHGHFDHWGGLPEILKRCRKGIPFYVGDEIFLHRYSTRPGSEDLVDLGSLDREFIERHGGLNIVEVKEPIEVMPGCWLCSDIKRITGYEKGSTSLVVERNGVLEQDLFPGEMAIVANVKGKGLVVISGCAHAGIVNTVRHAQKITGIDKVHAVMGGFHLVNADPGVIEKTIADIITIGPDYIIPMHCTGFEAVTTFRNAMTEQFILNTAGTRYSFGS